MTTSAGGIAALVDAVLGGSPDRSWSSYAGDRLAQALETSGPALYEQVADQSSLALFLVSTEGWIVSANPATCRLLGRTSAQLRTLTVADITHPEDVGMSRERLTAALAGDLDSYRVAKRYVRADGSVVHVDVTVTLIRDEGGEPLGFFAAAVDETSRFAAEVETRQAQRRADRSDELLAASMDSLMDPWVYLQALRDPSGAIVDFVYVHANKRACEHNGLPHGELVGRTLLGLLPQHATSLLDRYAAVVETGEPLALDDYPFPSPDGTLGWFDNRAVRVGQDGLSFTWRDVTAQHHMREELARHADTDPLTGLLNRRGLVAALDRVRIGDERRASRTETVAVFACDLDGLKALNDDHGHGLGDAVLVAVADRIAGVLRGTDIVARVGGDEFTVVAPGVDDSTAAEVALKIASAVTRPVRSDGFEVVPTISIGVAVSTSVAEVEALMGRADAALRRSKDSLYAGRPRR